MAQPYELSLTEAVGAIRTKQLSPVELVISLLDRIETLEPKLQAWATLTPELALEAARLAESEIAAGTSKGPLHGVPFGAKDIFDTAGIRTAAGSKIWAERVPDADAASITRAKNAGGILLGKLHTSEFADGDPAASRNPWNTAHTPGGSSAGSGVAVAARMTPWAFGSQTVGSVLRPAAYNGVVGFKPTFGRISRTGVIPMADTFDHVGVLARSVRDVATLLNVLAGYDANDPHSIDEPTEDYVVALERTSPPHLGLVRRWFLEESDAETRLKMEEVSQELARAGATIEEIDPGIDFADAYVKHRVMVASELATFHEPMYRGNEALYGPKITDYIESGFLHTGTMYIAAANLRRAMQSQAREALANVDALLTPTASGPAPSDLTQTGDTRFQSPWSYTGFPSITVPVGLSTNGLPLGAQMASLPFHEAKLLGVAKWVEQILGLDLIPPL